MMRLVEHYRSNGNTSPPGQVLERLEAVQLELGHPG